MVFTNMDCVELIIEELKSIFSFRNSWRMPVLFINLPDYYFIHEN